MPGWGRRSPSAGPATRGTWWSKRTPRSSRPSRPPPPTRMTAASFPDCSSSRKTAHDVTPEQLSGDKAYGSGANLELLDSRGITGHDQPEQESQPRRHRPIHRQTTSATIPSHSLPDLPGGQGRLSTAAGQSFTRKASRRKVSSSSSHRAVQWLSLEGAVQPRPPRDTGGLRQLLPATISADAGADGERSRSGSLPAEVPDRAQGRRPGAVLRDEAMSLPGSGEGQDSHAAGGYCLQRQTHGPAALASTQPVARCGLTRGKIGGKTGGT